MARRHPVFEQARIDPIESQDDEPLLKVAKLRFLLTRDRQKTEEKKNCNLANV
jgi:hypothetical protein